MFQVSTLSKFVSVVALCVVASTGCKKKDEPAAPKESAEEPQKAAELTPEKKLEQDVEALAAVLDMPEDYIKQAEGEINADNLLEQLDKLEKELAEEEAANPAGAPAAPGAQSNAVSPNVNVQPKAPKPAAP